MRRIRNYSRRRSSWTNSNCSRERELVVVIRGLKRKPSSILTVLTSLKREQVIMPKENYELEGFSDIKNILQIKNIKK